MRIIVAGGGTAGHIEPALAIARRWQLAHPDSQITFLGTKAGLETTLVPAAGFALTLIPKVSVPRRISPQLLLLPFSLLRAISQSKKAIKGDKASVTTASPAKASRQPRDGQARPKTQR